MDDLFSTNYQCVIDARQSKDEARNTRECCRESGGELLDINDGQCIFRDMMRNPREEWRNCAMQQRGAEFAECYYREQKEVDDKLQEDRRNNRDGRKGRNDHGNGRSQVILGSDEDQTRNRQYVCSIVIDQESRDQVLRDCCLDAADGRLTNDEETVCHALLS